MPESREESGSGTTGAQVVPAVSRATRVLEALVRSPLGASLTELAEACDLAKSSSSNLLRTMVAEGLVSYDAGTRRYNLGPMLVEFGVAAITRTTAVTEARPFMEELAARTELACLAIQPMPDGHFTAIAKIESRKAIKVTIEVGERFHATSPLLSRLHRAWRPESEFEDGPAAPGDAALAIVRERGYGAVFGEYRPQLNVAGFPVFDSDALPCLYVTLLGMGEDLTGPRVEEIGDYLIEAAHAITTRSGGHLPADYPKADGSPTLG